METTKSEPDVDSPVREIAKPASTTADTGTYTCTYHGCTERFESPAKLQSISGKVTVLQLPARLNHRRVLHPAA